MPARILTHYALRLHQASRISDIQIMSQMLADKLEGILRGHVQHNIAFPDESASLILVAGMQLRTVMAIASSNGTLHDFGDLIRCR